ncbi:MAG: nucleoside-triphosphatase [Bryobacterales bacterium]|nr:nucleoside-triphosphatase [Bryobacteraceae bacterium]MDW8129153.1 nucleoside-triphosphatase [Bryobacterales bacterium]
MGTSTFAIASERFPPATNLVWRRAAALGSLWAAFEIVVGSFLHNLRVPFTGAVLASLGVLLMCAGVRVWKDRGLVWRAALICALMKSVSPSAVILNPMIGIFVEGLLLQLGLAVLGRNWLGCAAGGAAAVSVTLVQKIVSLLIVYGLDVVRLYEGLVRYAARVTGWQGLGPEEPILWLLGVQAALGAAAGLTGWRWGGRYRPSRPAEPARERAAIAPQQRRREPPGLQPSLAWLAAVAAALPGGMYLVAVSPLVVSIPVIGLAVGCALWRYGGALRRLRRPRLWVELGAVLLLASLVLGAIEGDVWRGLHSGAQMILRAVYVVVMFSAISVELKNPRLTRRLAEGRLAAAGAALEAAFRALPDFLSMMPAVRAVLRDPEGTLATLFDRVEYWQSRSPALVLLTGARGEGKTTLCAELAKLVRDRGHPVAGILSPGSWSNGRRTAYQVQDLLSGEIRPLALRSDQPGPIRQGAFLFDPAGLEFGRAALAAGAASRPGLLIVDEVGPLELRGEGWAAELDRLHAEPCCAMLWVVRPELLEQVRQRWPGLRQAEIVRAAETSPARLAGLLLGAKTPGAVAGESA